ncbi:isocitrate lyase/phosphoenolpyruvate mutase family protein [Zoogloea sp.]|uniref:isocitrate lyase/PEP mutase family protein n=1 Tax=Zoogloea sp. TaxID=49181 RepID=UPI001416426D|nr:MAG: isocitrate lyase/phosphoenolpyruvate mutase family protein [Zoogloea sp.]
MDTQHDKALRFQALHRQDDCFIVPNPWDPGSARLLAHLGFPALATTGAGFAFSRGLPDGAVGREAMLAHVRDLACATALPLSVDLENGFGDAPETVAETIRLAAEAGAVGGSIEDTSGKREAPLYPLSQAVERIQAAVEAARRLPFPFTLTARAENFMAGHPDLDDALRRLQAYEAAGADVLFAPGLKSREQIAAMTGALSRPVNVIMGFQGVRLNLDELRALGVRRVSVGGSLARAALGAFLRAAREIRDEGSFGYADEAIPGPEINRLFRQLARPA